MIERRFQNTVYKALVNLFTGSYEFEFTYIYLK